MVSPSTTRTREALSVGPCGCAAKDPTLATGVEAGLGAGWELTADGRGEAPADVVEPVLGETSTLVHAAKTRQADAAATRTVTPLWRTRRLTRRPSYLDAECLSHYCLAVVSSGSAQPLVIDSSSLIYLAKLEALDVFPVQSRALMTAGVRREVLVPQAAVRFPEMARIDRAIGEGRLGVEPLQPGEQRAADDLGTRIPGLGVGERESIAIAGARALALVLHDRRASRIGRAMGIDVVGPVYLLFERTVDDGLLDARVRAFARLVDMRIEVLEQLLERVKERSR